MRKIMIIGSGGAGKSTLAKQLGNLLHIPVYHLDSLFWKPGWQVAERQEWIEKQLKLMEQESWILDGNYGATMEVRLQAADTVIFLDYSTIRCLYGIVKRRIQYHGRTRPDMGEGCPEKLDLEFIRWVARFKKDKSPTIKERLKQSSEINIIRLTGPKQTKHFLQELQQEIS
ncbi:DNA topology modulation protein [Radiobacillus kanasensis]|uniref:DNA topology modulation protein n=1 Tax=Radiobacillus kanasensis TaxID=2844358 RepID=UPI001E534D9B|nr:DNA topology modulation protein [Radiobacillus kanasensis]UFU00316.1 DNA topology modulation protein [Radiobacillus kanasensis]